MLLIQITDIMTSCPQTGKNSEVVGIDMTLRAVVPLIAMLPGVDGEMLAVMKRKCGRLPG